VSLAQSGKSIAVVSDAGTPGISDPGTELAAALAESGVTVHPVPGCSAVAAALSICGFPCTPFTFVGFLPVKGAARKGALEQIAQTSHTVVFYEAPHRIQRTLRDIASHASTGSDSSAPGAMAGRRAVCCRELTKLHEQISRGTVAQLLQALDGDDQELRLAEEEDPDVVAEGEDTGDRYSGTGIRSKGEFTVVLGPVSAKDTVGDATQESSEDKLAACLESLRTDGMRRSEAVKLCMEMLKLPKSVVYSKALAIPGW
jgi:16S rRNA C1402 (ribose-2'-O) methylase RsmI